MGRRLIIPLPVHVERPHYVPSGKTVALQLSGGKLPKAIICQIKYGVLHHFELDLRHFPTLSSFPTRTDADRMAKAAHLRELIKKYEIWEFKIEALICLSSIHSVNPSTQHSEL